MSNISSRKKILFVITKSNWGGAQRYVYDLATSLPSKGFDVVVALGGDGVLSEKLQIAEIRTIKIQGLERDIRIVDELRVFKQLLAIFRKEKPDIVHLNSSKIGALGALAGRITNINKIIFTVHGWAFNEDRTIISKLIIRLFSWITIILCHKVITISYGDTQQAVAFPLVANKIHLIHVGIGNIIFKNREESRRVISKRTVNTPQENSIWIGTIAELHKNKGLTYAFDALSKLQHTGHKFFYTIIGEGEERVNLERYIQKKGLSQSVSLLGYIENAAELLPAFDIFLIPSLKEGLPYVLLEAGLAEIPTVASSVGGIPEVIENNVSSVLTSPKNADQMRESLEKLMHDQKQRTSFGNQLKQIVQNKFTLERMLRDTITLYRN